MKFNAILLLSFFAVFLLPQVCFSGKTDADKKVYTSLQEAIHDGLLVEILDLRRSGLREFPSEISSLSNLRELYLSHNKIEELPSQIGSLKKLEILDLSANKLTTVPYEIGNLILLRELLLYRNDISVLPPSIGNLKSLTKLDLWSNELEFLPPEVMELNGLKELDLRGILISYDDQKKISKKLSSTQIYFSSPCNCAK